jgi:hypothetical protein
MQMQKMGDCSKMKNETRKVNYEGFIDSLIGCLMNNVLSRFLGRLPFSDS